jgi:hypothetical protein
MSDAHKQWILWTTIIVVLVSLAGASVWFYLQTRKSPPVQADARSKLEQLKSQADMPLYFPAPLPVGFEAPASEVGFIEDGVVGFTLVQQEKKLLVTQQVRPSLMEEVNKKVEFTTSVGKAYIADLNGRQTGFLLTSSTLVIITSPDKIGNEQLQQVLESMQKL